MPTWMKRSKTGTYSLRVRVPGDLRSIIGKREIKQSYRTKEFEEAKRLHRYKEVEVQELLDNAKAQLQANQSKGAARNLLPGEVDRYALKRIIRKHHVECLGHARRKFPNESQDAENPSPSDREDFAEILEQELTILRDSGDPNTMASMQQSAKGLLEANFGPCEVPSQVLLDLAEMLRRSTVDIFRQRIGWYRGEDPDDVSPLELLPEPETTAIGGGLKLSELIEQYLNDPSSRRSEKTKDGYRQIIRVMEDVFGSETPIAEIDRSKCREVQQVIMYLPPNATKLKGYKSLTPSKAAEKAKNENVAPLAVKTANNALNNMSSIFEWAVQEGCLENNPAKRLRLPRPDEDARDKRKPFSTEQLNKIFNGPIYEDKAGVVDSPNFDPKKSGDYWVPLLALFTGMRSNECCQLLTADIDKINGVDVIRVTKDGSPDKRLKTAASKRIIPVHPKLVEMGFVDYVKQMRERGEERLFPDIKKSAKGYYSDIFQKRFGRYLVRVDAKEPKTSFHSFRHNFRDAMRFAEVTDWVAKRLGGWKEEGTDAVYGGNCPSSYKLEQLPS